MAQGHTLPAQFTATLQKSPEKGGWTSVVMPGSADFFGTRGLVKVGAPSTVTAFEARSWPWATARTSCPSGPRYETP
jgi:hypothetical protein